MDLLPWLLSTLLVCLAVSGLSAERPLERPTRLDIEKELSLLELLRHPSPLRRAPEEKVVKRCPNGARCPDANVVDHISEKKKLTSDDHKHDLDLDMLVRTLGKAFKKTQEDHVEDKDVQTLDKPFKRTEEEPVDKRVHGCPHGDSRGCMEAKRVQSRNGIPLEITKLDILKKILEAIDDDEPAEKTPVGEN